MCPERNTGPLGCGPNYQRHKAFVTNGLATGGGLRVTGRHPITLEAPGVLVLLVVE